MIKLTLAGYIGSTKFNTLPNGDPVLNFSLAVSVGTKENPKTEWVDCSIWGNRAVALEPHIRKGMFLCLDGRAGIRTWLAQEDSGPRGTLTCRVDNLTFGPRSDTPEVSQDATAPSTAQAQKSGFMSKLPADEDIPF